MENIINCSRCGKNLIKEEYSEHICNPNLKGIIQIGVSYWFTGKTNPNGDQIFMAKGFDGNLYQMVLCKHIPPHVSKIPKIREINHFQPKGNTENNSREDNSTILWELLP